MNNAHPSDAGFLKNLIDFVAQTKNSIYECHTLRWNWRTTMVRKNTMNGGRAKRHNCCMQTTRGNCEQGRDNDGLAGDGATIYSFFFLLWVPLCSRI